MTQHKTKGNFYWAVLCGFLAATLAGCLGPGYLAYSDRVEMSQRIIKESPSYPGPCEMCGEPSEAKQQRRILTYEGRLVMEFCSEECAYKFYSNPFWRTVAGWKGSDDLKRFRRDF